MPLDTQLFFLLNGLAGRSPTIDSLIVFCATYLAYIIVVAFVLLLAFSSYTHREKIRVIVIALVATLIARGVVTEGIRFLYHRPRPFVTYPVHQLIAENSWSFPSGHSITFFALASAVYFYNKKWGILFFVAAAVIAVSRVVAGVHYPSDIIGGALLGIGIGYGVFYVAEKCWPASIKSRLSEPKKP